MFRSGIFVKTDLEHLISSLPDRLITEGPSRLSVETGPEEARLEDYSVLELSRWSDRWCIIEVDGPEDLLALVVQSVVKLDPVQEVLNCGYNPEAGEYSYAYYKEGTALETFESRGPSIETVNFTSEIRKVRLQDLLRASDFMAESLIWLGMGDTSQSPADKRKTRIYVKLPGKKTFWQSLLGTAWSR